MTNVTPDPDARRRRLLRRAKDLQLQVSALTEDLRGVEEGEGACFNAAVQLVGVIHRLERNAEQQSGS